VEDLPPAELERRICGTNPEWASATALVGEDAAARADRRGGVSPQRLSRLLHGDLDTILSKAMQKEPLRRYASSAELADDVGRHLSGLPVRARRDTLAYRASRFARRHRLVVAVAAVAFAALLASLALALLGFERARRAEAVAQTYQRRYAAAEALQRENLDIRKRMLGPEHPQTLASRNNLANAIGYQGRYAEAESLHRENLDIQTRVLGAGHPNTLMSIYNLGCFAALRGDREQALRHLRDALERGFIPSPDLMENDPELASLHADPEFQRLVAAANDNQKRATRMQRAGGG
jgi:serine/threonine-protein kinase